MSKDNLPPYLDPNIMNIAKKAIEEAGKEKKVKIKRWELVKRYKISLLDYNDAVVDAIVEKFPELKEHPILKAFYEREKSFENAIKLLKELGFEVEE